MLNIPNIVHNLGNGRWHHFVRQVFQVFQHHSQDPTRDDLEIHLSDTLLHHILLSIHQRFRCIPIF